MNRPHDDACAGPPGREPAHCLSFDVEEYFQVEAAARCGIRREDWPQYAARLAPAVDRVLQALDDHGTRATFFILGWVAEQQGDVVRRIADAGHEVASHGMAHQMLQRLDADAFRRDLLDSRRLLEDLAGRPVAGYRAPTFSVTHETAWALDVLAEARFRYDSSVFPVRHDRYGVPDAPAVIHRATGPGGGSIIEVPPLTWRLAGTNWPMGGGGYLRLLPVRAVGWALRSAERRSRCGMIYLHPWELDPGQPVLPMGRLTCWRHRVGLARTEAKLRWLLARFRFSSVAERLDALAGSPLPTFAYGRR